MMTSFVTGYVIQLANGRLWAERDADSASVFSSRENAEGTIAGTRIAALRSGTVLRCTGPTETGAALIEGYWTVAA